MAASPLREYAELHCLSNFSFLRGASHPEELVGQAAALGYRAIAITDRNSLAGVVRAHVAAKEHGIHLIIGAEITPIDGPPIVLLAPTREAYGRLCRLITRGRLRSRKGECEIRVADIEELGAGAGWIGIVGSENWEVGIGKSEEGSENSEPERHIPPTSHLPIPTSHFPYRSILAPHLYLAATLTADAPDAQRLEWLAQRARDAALPLVAVNAVHYHAPQRRYLQDVLTCIREKCTLQTAGSRLFANAERRLRRLDEIARRYAGYEALIDRSVEIAAGCTFSLDELRYEYPHELVPPGVTAMEHLTRLTWEGASERYPDGVPPRVRELVVRELGLIDELRYEHYFLTVYDLVDFARSRGILCQGRGSAANSAVCYCLGVTAVDPDRIDLLFERFISKERNEPPDIDIDFEHERREEVFQYIYNKYGRERAAIVAEVITYRPRSAVRDVGKALGLSLDRVDAIAKALDWWSSEATPEEALRTAGLSPEDRTVRMLVKLVRQLQGFPRHLSQHVGGFVLTESPLCEIVPLENGAMPGRTFIEWDKDDIDAVGLLKVDCLALGTLTAIRRCLSMLSTVKPSEPEAQARDKRAPSEPEAQARGKRALSEPEAQARGEPELATRDFASKAPISIAPEGRWLPAGGVSPRSGSPEFRRPGGGRMGGARHAPPLPFQGDDERGGAHSAGLSPRLLTSAPPGRWDHAAGADGDLACASGSDGQSLACASGSDGRPLAGASGSDGRPLACASGSDLGCVTPSSLAAIPPEDPHVYDAICRADTVGVFQIESRAQMSMLPRLKPRCFYDLVIEVAIVRPGPIQGGMVHPYLRRRDGLEPVTYPSEAIRDVLGKTLGVPLFQEQVMKVAVVAAGFTPGEADQLRRGMAAWRRGGQIDKFHTRLLDGMLRNGYSPQFAEQIFNQIRGFGEYGFPESHAASFALLVYASAWLKCYHPAAFCGALLNSQPMGFYAPAQLIADARRHGVEVRPVDVLFSEWDCTLERAAPSEPEAPARGKPAEPEAPARVTRSEPEARARGKPAEPEAPARDTPTPPALRLGFRLIRGLSEEKIRSVIAVRARLRERGLISEAGVAGGAVLGGAPGPDGLPLARASGSDCGDLAGASGSAGLPLARASGSDRGALAGASGSDFSAVPRDTLLRLAAADAFRSLGLDRRQALWRILAMDGDAAPSLFDALDPCADEPPAPLPSMPIDEAVVQDYDAIGLSLTAHPIGLLRPELARLGVIPNDQLRTTRQRRRVRVAGLVTHRQRPSTAKGIVFMTLEDETGGANLIVRPQIWERYAAVARLKLALLVDGRVERQGEVVHVQVTQVHDLSRAVAPVRATSRDFH